MQRKIGKHKTQEQEGQDHQKHFLAFRTSSVYSFHHNIASLIAICLTVKLIVAESRTKVNFPYFLKVTPNLIKNKI